MKIFKLIAIALVAMVGFTACDKDCDHDFIEYDYNEALIGTWTYIAEDGLAETMVINPDGSFNVTGVMKGGSLYEEKGTIKVVNNKVSLVFEGDKDVIEGRLELVTGKSLSIVLNEEYDIRLTYDYCDKDLSDEIVGMWVCMQEAFGQEEEMVIQIFDKNGICTFTGYVPDVNGYIKEAKCNYKVFGNLLITTIVDNNGAPISSVAIKVDITPNAIEYGDIMSTYNPILKTTSTFLRVKQSLNLANKTYDYNSAYVTNVNGKDEDFSVMGHTFNIAKLKAGDFDMMLRSELFCLETNANLIKYNFILDNGQSAELDVPISVENNKVTLDMSAAAPGLRKVDVYMFQDADDSQLHMYMHKDAFINYFANLEIVTLLSEGKIDLTDAAAVEKVFADMDARIESINVSFVFKARK